MFAHMRLTMALSRPSQGQQRRGWRQRGQHRRRCRRSSPRSTCPRYSSSKAGLVAFTKNLSRRWVDDGIRVNAVAPGLIDTRMTHPVLDIPEMLEPEMRHTPMGRMGMPDEVSGAVLFLCTDSASYITGSTSLSTADT